MLRAEKLLCKPCWSFVLMGINYCPDKLRSWTSLVDCEVSQCPSTYLGMLLGVIQNAMILEAGSGKGSKMVGGHLGKAFFSKGGRLTLMQSVLIGIPSYFLSFLRISTSMSKNIEREKIFLFGKR